MISFAVFKVEKIGIYLKICEQNDYVNMRLAACFIKANRGRFKNVTFVV
jgi:hypothetical protein